jgi:hypothetical protein
VEGAKTHARLSLHFNTSPTPIGVGHARPSLCSAFEIYHSYRVITASQPRPCTAVSSLAERADWRALDKCPRHPFHDSLISERTSQIRAVWANQRYCTSTGLMTLLYPSQGVLIRILIGSGRP